MTTALLDCVEIGSEQAERAIIWLHGLGANGHDFEPVVRELDFNPDTNIRFVFPHAPNREVTINAGVSMPAWYDIRAMDFTQDEDIEGIHASQQQIDQLIQREQQRGVACENIMAIITTIHNIRTFACTDPRLSDCMSKFFLYCYVTYFSFS